MKGKKLTGLMLALIMAAGSLTACAGNGQNVSESTAEKTTAAVAGSTGAAGTETTAGDFRSQLPEDFAVSIMLSAVSYTHLNSCRSWSIRWMSPGGIR